MRKRAAMHRDILVPTDGSPASRRAIREATALARKLGARVVGLHVITPFEGYAYRTALPAVITVPDFEKHARSAAGKILAAVRKAAAERGVGCLCHTIWDTSAAGAILTAARVHRCGYIVMATHGRRGLQRVLLGSVTQKVLAGSRIPVLVCR